MYRSRNAVTTWWCWAVIARRLLFVCAFAYSIEYGTQAALGALGIVAISFAIAQHFVQPYVNKDDNTSEFMSLAGISLLCHVGHVAGKEAIIPLVVVISVFPVVSILQAKWKTRKLEAQIRPSDVAIVRSLVHPAAVPLALQRFRRRQFDALQRSVSFQDQVEMLERSSETRGVAF